MAAADRPNASVLVMKSADSAALRPNMSLLLFFVRTPPTGNVGPERGHFMVRPRRARDGAFLLNAAAAGALPLCAAWASARCAPSRLRSVERESDTRSY